MKPIVLINFKLYPEAVGDKALPLAKKIAKVKTSKYRVAIAPTSLTLKEIAQKVKIPVFAQHCSHVSLGAHTGRISAKELKDIGVKGVILNHSERKIPLKYLPGIVEECRKNKLEIVICASSLSEVKKVAVLKPKYLAYEPKELIGGNTSVTEAKPDIIIKAVELSKKISKRTRVLAGAGIHSMEDIGNALMLGTNGVLIGHAVPKAKDPKRFLESLLL
jgi:triosephosphate isomerase